MRELRHWWQSVPIPVEGRLSVPIAELDRLGSPLWEDDLESWDEGLPPSPSRQWRVEAPCGLVIFLRQDWVPEVDWSHAADQALVFGATADELRHALLHLPFETARLVEVWGDQARATGWVVTRLDDNGYRDEVGRYPSEASAQCVAALLESRGHKQCYGVERFGPPVENPNGEWALVRRRPGEDELIFARFFDERTARRVLAQEKRLRGNPGQWLRLAHLARSSDHEEGDAWPR